MGTIKAQVAAARDELANKRHTIRSQIATLEADLRALDRQAAMLDAIEHPERIGRSTNAGRGTRGTSQRRTGVSDSVIAALQGGPRTLKDLREAVGGGASLGSTLSHLKKAGKIAQDAGSGRNRAYRLP